MDSPGKEQYLGDNAHDAVLGPSKHPRVRTRLDSQSLQALKSYGLGGERDDVPWTRLTIVGDGSQESTTTGPVFRYLSSYDNVAGGAAATMST